MMDESDGDEAAPEVAEETAPTPAADDWVSEWKRKMRGQLPTQHELNVAVMRAAANSPAKGILRMLAFYAGHHLTVDQIARSVLVPPGRVEVLLGHLHAYGHVEQHSASGATTYSARPDALEHYLTTHDDADRAATPTPAPAPAPVAEPPREGAPAAGPDPTGDARLAGDGDATPAEDEPVPAPAPAREDVAPAVLTRDEGGTAPAPAPREGSPTPAEEGAKYLKRSWTRRGPWRYVRTTQRRETPTRMWTKEAMLPPTPLQSLIEGRRRDASRARRRPCLDGSTRSTRWIRSIRPIRLAHSTR